MLIRVRAPFGTPRVEVKDTATLKDLKRVVFALLQQEKVPVSSEEDIFLSLDPSGATPLLDNDTSLSSSKVSHGTMLYLIVDAPPPSSSSSSSSSSSKPTTQHPQAAAPATSKCTHPPNAKCVHCSTAQPAPPPAPKTTGTGKKIKWMCTHPPGAKCVNCMRPPKKTATSKCTHPPYMVCPNCMGDKSKEDGNAPKTDKGRCNHGPNAACANCRPALESDLVSSRCRNHGPHGSCTECMAREDRRKLRLKLQDSPHCVQVVVDYQAANTYQSYLQERKFRVQRCGFLYGRLNDDGSSTIEVIYEPPQRSEKDSITLLQDADEDRVEKIASLLGLTRMGWIFSHSARKYVMSAAEIQKAAELQNKFGERFVTLILSVNEKGQGNLEAFQVSDQAAKLSQQDMFLPSENPEKCKFKQPVYVEGAETNQADNHFFLVTVPVKSKDKSIFQSSFPVENREPAQSRSDLKVHLIHHAKRPFIEQVSDFHFLLFLSKGYLDLSTDFPTLCEAIVSDRSQDLSGFKMLLDNYLI